MAFQDSFKALADPTRREIITMLKGGRATAGEIVEHFDMTGATISHHLSILKNAGLVTDIKKGKYHYEKHYRKRTLRLRSHHQTSLRGLLQ